MTAQPNTLPTAPGNPSATPVNVPPRGESRGQRAARHGRPAGLYAWAFLAVALIVVLVALIVANTRAVKLDWVVGSTQASLVWIVLAATVIGWLLGPSTSILFRYRTRRPAPTDHQPTHSKELR